MIKVIYSMEQMQEISRHLNGLSVQGIEQSKLVVAIAQIIDSPLKLDDQPIDGIDHGPSKEDEKEE